MINLATAATPCSPPFAPTNTAIADTGASDHYFTPEAPVLNLNHNAPRTTIRTATGELKTSTASAHIALPDIPTAHARTVHVIPGFTNNLLSLGKLCDADCTAHFDKFTMTVHDKHGRLILQGSREPTGARLWRVNLIPTATPPSLTRNIHRTLCHTPQQLATVASLSPKPHARTYDLPTTPALIAYLHATAGFPVRQTWLAAIKRGAYNSWPGLTYTLAARYCPSADETLCGHMAQPRQHIRSTQHQHTRITSTDLVLPMVPPATPTIDITILPSNRIFTDATGRFTPRSRSGNQYIMVAYHETSNAILVQPFANKTDAHRIAAYTAIYDRLAARTAAPTLHILDNEASSAFLQAITNHNCKFQLVPPHVHRRNRAERAIRTFKDHFLAILAGIAPNFPRDRWDLLLPQAELTLNLLRPGPLNTPSAWEHLFGPYNFDATPIGPAGCRVLIHHKANIRRSWDFRCHDGFYCGPAMHHYRCYSVLNKASGAVTISDAVTFRHHYLREPAPTLEDKLLHALHAINTTIAHTPTAPPREQIAAIDTLRTILSTFKSRAGNDPHDPPTLAPTNWPTPGVPPLAPTHQPPPGVPTHRPPPTLAPTTRPTTRPTPGVPTPNPTIPTDPHAQDTMAPWTVVPTRPRRASNTPPLRDQPVAFRTRSRAHNAFAILADPNNDSDDTPVALPVLDTATGTQLEHRQLRRHPAYKATWDTSYANELGRLCQGIGTNATDPNAQRIEGTDTFRPIKYHDIPSDRRNDITYTRVVCEVRPQKQDPNRTRITIGGNRICYPGDTGTRTGSLELVKLMLNSVLSTKDARFACVDISNFYLGTPLDRPEYVRIKLTDIPDEFIDEYNLTTVEHMGWIYFEINKGVYGLKQAGKLANDLLTTRLATHGYYQCPMTPGLWQHKWRPIKFVLIVDDFGIQYVGRQHADHLLLALQEHYKITTDWTGSKFAGIDITWDYFRRTCRLTMQNYINTLLIKYNHPLPRKPQHAPHAHREIIYGAKHHYAPEQDTSPRLDDKGITRIQGIIGSLLYYARAVDNKLLATLSALSSQQANATENTAKAVAQLLDYVATYPNDGITYRASNMLLSAHSDASFLTEPNARSRAGAHIFLSENDPTPRQNGPVLTLSNVIKHVMASAAEAELAALYNTAREMIPLRNALDEMGWPQQKSPIQTDNSTAVGFVHDTIVQKRIKMIWMRIFWLKCRAAQGQFRFYWDKGTSNMADYHTKHHPPAYHLAHRATHAG